MKMMIIIICPFLEDSSVNFNKTVLPFTDKNKTILRDRYTMKEDKSSPNNCYNQQVHKDTVDGDGPLTDPLSLKF